MLFYSYNGHSISALLSLPKRLEKISSSNKFTNTFGNKLRCTQPETCEALIEDPAGCTVKHTAAFDEPPALSSNFSNSGQSIH